MCVPDGYPSRNPVKERKKATECEPGILGYWTFQNPTIFGFAIPPKLSSNLGIFAIFIHLKIDFTRYKNQPAFVCFFFSFQILVGGGMGWCGEVWSGG